MAHALRQSPPVAIELLLLRGREKGGESQAEIDVIISALTSQFLLASRPQCSYSAGQLRASQSTRW
jgi:hypothetical protein